MTAGGGEIFSNWACLTRFAFSFGWGSGWDAVPDSPARVGFAVIVGVNWSGLSGEFES